VTRAILTPDAHWCVSGCGAVETSQHLFVSCPIFGELWLRVRAWIGIVGADSYDIADHFVQLSYLAGVTASKRSFMQLLWLLCISVLWTERNNRHFNNTESSITQMVEKVQVHSYWWLKAAKAVNVLGVNNWLASPLNCLGIS